MTFYATPSNDTDTDSLVPVVMWLWADTDFATIAIQNTPEQQGYIIRCTPEQAVTWCRKYGYTVWIGWPTVESRNELLATREYMRSLHCGIIREAYDNPSFADLDTVPVWDSLQSLFPSL